MKSNSARRFSIKFKLLIVFTSFIITSLIILGFLALNIARNAVEEQVSIHLKDKVQDTASIIDVRISTLFQFIERIARMPVFIDMEKTFFEKAEAFKNEVKYNSILHDGAIADSNGKMIKLSSLFLFLFLVQHNRLLE